MLVLVSPGQWPVLSPVSNSISAFRPGQTTDDHHGHASNQPHLDHDSILIMILIIAAIPTRTGVFYGRSSLRVMIIENIKTWKLLQ